MDRPSTSPRRTGRPARLLLAAIVASALGLTVASPILAVDPTAAPTADPSVTPAPTPTPEPVASPSPAPTATPDPTPSPAPSATPGTIPTPGASVTPAPGSSSAPGATPGASPAASATPGSTPAATPTPYGGIQFGLTPGQQPGRNVGPAQPLFKLAPPFNGPQAGVSPHNPPSTLTSDTCAACHQTHTGKQVALGNVAGTQAALCQRCHTTGNTFNTVAQFSGKPANNPATASYYSHPVSDASAANHSLAELDEFAGVSDRHAVCADCHQPHIADSTRPQQSTTGWTASGAIRYATGVAVTNGTITAGPTYTLKRFSQNAGALTYEYELCLKCHSGYTELLTPVAGHPSWWALDKGIEMNPANTAYHPVEAAGKNVSRQMQGSLSGTSPFKAWNLSVDSVIRCTQCHGDPTTVNQTASATPLTPAADAYEASHASPNRGLLIAPYQDRTLKPAGQGYSAAQFALCYLCHAERPFTDTDEDPAATDTSFYLHGRHIRDIGGSGSNNTIDTAGAGQGLAICAECHFRIHSNALAFKSGDTVPVTRADNYPSLVNFAPNVTGAGGTGSGIWNVPNTSGIGSCALRCHGYTHTVGISEYQVAPATGFTASPTSGPKGVSGLTVTFADATRYVNTGTATYSWLFGDGGTSTTRNPTHTYTVAGTYSVTLTVTRPGGGSQNTMSMTRTAYITVTP